jgi:hypothetical protein
MFSNMNIGEVMSDMAPFAREFSSDRLKAFRTRFRPSTETLAQRLANLALTAGIYGAVLAAAALLVNGL